MIWIEELIDSRVSLGEFERSLVISFPFINFQGIGFISDCVLTFLFYNTSIASRNPENSGVVRK